MDRWMAGEARVIRASNYIELLEARPRRSAVDSIRSVSEVEEVVCVCVGNRGYMEIPVALLTRPAMTTRRVS